LGGSFRLSTSPARQSGAFVFHSSQYQKWSLQAPAGFWRNWRKQAIHVLTAGHFALWRLLRQLTRPSVDVCTDAALEPFNIDAKLNGGYVALGLLYGEE